MSSQKILFLTVLYKTKCKESETLKSLMPQIKGHSIYIWDNSPLEDVDNAEYLASNTPRYEYLYCPENKPLAYVYEQSIIKAKNEDFSHIVILDQDSILDTDWVSKLEVAISRSAVSVIIPDVFVGELLVSPAHSWKWFGWRLNSEKEVNNSFVSAINSGVCIPVAQFIDTQFSFPSGLKNYGTDVYLFEHVRTNKINVLLTHSTIQHDLTFHKSNPDNNSYFNSYVQHMLAMRIIFSKGVFGSALFNMYILCHGLKVSLTRKDKRFFTWWING